MKIIICLVLSFFWGIIGVSAQSNYYQYYNGKKIYLTLDKSKINVTTKSNLQKSNLSFTCFKNFELYSDTISGVNNKFAQVEFISAPQDSNYFQIIDSLKSINDIITISPYFLTSDTSSIGTSAIFYVKLKDTSDYPILQAYATAKNVIIVKKNKYMPLWYRLAVTDSTLGNSLDMANYFYETGLFDKVDPSFIFNFKPNCSNDTHFDKQWGLYNSNNSDIDINACDAWTISQGEGIKVAVFDDGIDKLHNDLKNNIYPLSYDAKTGTSPSTYDPNKYHGTYVAGIIGAEGNNNLDITGVAPKSKLISISSTPIDLLGPFINTGEIDADAMNWAWIPEIGCGGGADVINNSWGDDGGNLFNYLGSHLLDDAIRNALTFGRNGKGCVVVFASGNSNVINYPANLDPDILCVGAIDRQGELMGGSGSGYELDVVAPGVDLCTTNSEGGVVYKNGVTPIEKEVTGTSYAAPHVSGIAALILSYKPELTQKQVSEIIELTAQKIGDYSYSYDFNRPNGGYNKLNHELENGNVGYGLVDAYAALKKLQCFENKTLVKGAIEENTIWNTNVYAYGLITIEEGVTLTITSTVSCDPSTLIVVKPGAKLIVDGGVLTGSECEPNKYWQGIRVLGNSKLIQNNINQGLLVLKNNAIIENARNAVSVFFPDDWSTTGGIVDAKDAIFKNNIRSVEYVTYKQFIQHNLIMDNLGKFEKCKFEWDNNMYPHDKKKLYHVSLYGVNGVKFVSCNFKNSLDINSNIDETHGIYSLESGYTVTSRTIEDIDKTTFENLKYGIKSTNANPYHIKIEKSKFLWNTFSIFIASSDNVIINANNFSIPSVPFWCYECIDLPLGVAMYKSAGFNISQNLFKSISPSSSISMGLQIDNSGSSFNEVKNNVFEDLLLSTEARGNNKGLRYICNDFHLSENAIIMEESYGETNNGVCTYQNSGGNNRPAGNIFPDGVGAHIVNNTNSNIQYYYSNGNYEEPLNITENVFKYYSEQYPDCSMNHRESDNNYLNQLFASLENDYITLLYNYNSLLDGGSTDDLLNEVQGSWGDDVWGMRQEFINISPYVSAEVLIELAISQKLPLPIYLEIALSNPEATQQREYIEFMNSYEGSNILTNSGIESIIGSWDTRTFRSTMESNISSKLNNMEGITRELIYRKVSDTLGFNISDYRSLLNNVRDINGKLELIESYVFADDFESANALLNILSLDPKNERYGNEISNYISLVDILQDRDTISGKIPIDERIILLSQSNTRAGSKAKAYLDFCDTNTNYFPEYSYDLNTKSIVVKGVKSSKLFEADVKLSPNPAKDYITLSYNLKPIPRNYICNIYDNKGNVINSVTLRGNKGIQSIDIRNFNQGNYVYVVEDGKERVKRGKFVVVR